MAFTRVEIQAYRKWLEVLQKGIGETLQDAGFFDAALGEDDNDEYYLNEYDDVTDRRGSEYNPRGERDERGGYPQTSSWVGAEGEGGASGPRLQCMMIDEGYKNGSVKAEGLIDHDVIEL